MGAGKLGEIAALISIVVPDVAIVLKVGLAHVGEFGGPDAVERAKSEMVTELPSTAVAVLNADDQRVANMAGSTRRGCAGSAWPTPPASAPSDVGASATGTDFTPERRGTSHPRWAPGRCLRILGEHHVMNALAAIAAAHALGVPVERSVPALEELARAERWRMEVLAPAAAVV